MKVQNQKFQNINTAAASLIRNFLIAWLIAAAVEYLSLPSELKSLTGLQGIAAMSFPRMLIVMGVVLVLLEGLSRLLRREADRWVLPGVFAVLAVFALGVSFTWAFLAGSRWRLILRLSGDKLPV